MGLGGPLVELGDGLVLLVDGLHEFVHALFVLGTQSLWPTGSFTPARRARATETVSMAPRSPCPPSFELRAQRSLLCLDGDVVEPLSNSAPVTAHTVPTLCAFNNATAAQCGYVECHRAPLPTVPGSFLWGRRGHGDGPASRPQTGRSTPACAAATPASRASEPRLSPARRLAAALAERECTNTSSSRGARQQEEGRQGAALGVGHSDPLARAIATRMSYRRKKSVYCPCPQPLVSPPTSLLPLRTSLNTSHLPIRPPACSVA